MFLLPLCKGRNSKREQSLNQITKIKNMFKLKTKYKLSDDQENAVKNITKFFDAKEKFQTLW